MAPTTKNPAARIEVFRPGTFKPMEGAPITYSAADLQAIADAYDPETAPAPIVVGHPEADAPAYGWIGGFSYDTAGERLMADLIDIEPAFADQVRAGRYRKVSMSFFRPEQAANPVPGTWYPKHLGFLGAAAPAVSGLKNARFVGPSSAAVTFTTAFGDAVAQETASLLRSLRDFFIDRFSLEEADKALPAWRIEWLENADTMPGFAAPPVAPAPTEPKEPAVTKTPSPSDTAALAARETELTARETQIAAREAAIAHDAHASFAEKLVSEGRLLPASKDKVVAILDVLPGHAAVSFTEGGAKMSAGAAIRELLQAQPKVVSYGAAVLPDDGDGRAAAFASDGKTVDPAQLELHEKAQAYQRQHPGTSYIAAVKAVS